MATITFQEAAALIETAQSIPREQRLKLQNERLRALVEYARKNSPYFQKLYAGLPDDFSLASLPATEKAELMTCYEDWVCDRKVRQKDVFDYLDRRDGSLYLGSYTALTTSGTTGSPMPMLRDGTHNTVHGALTAGRLMRGMPDMFDPAKHRIASIIFTDPHVSSYSSFMRARAARPEFAENMLAISPTEGTAELVRRLNEYQPDVITCYPSAMCSLALEQQKGTLRLALRCIACSAEVLTEEMYELFTRTFDCPVINNYCSTEGGEVAMASGCPHLHVNEDWVIVEPVDAEKRPVKDAGEWSDGVLITDLSNYIQPVIRYYMNDKVKLHEGCDCGSDLPWIEIQGRAGGLAEICGKNVIMPNLYTALSYTEGAYFVQFAQTAPDALEIRVQFTPDADREAVFNSLEKRLRALLEKEGCAGCRVIRSQKEPARAERGGKLQWFIKLF